MKHVVTDLETTHLDEKVGSIIEIAAVILPTKSGEKAKTFQTLVKPLAGREINPESMQVNGINLDDIDESGLEPAAALALFSQWVVTTCEKEKRLLVAYNVEFDKKWLDHYYELFSLPNPFNQRGYADGAIDLKAMYYGAMGGEISWHKTKTSYNPHLAGNHRALADAVDEAKLLKAILNGEFRNPAIAETVASLEEDRVLENALG